MLARIILPTRVLLNPTILKMAPPPHAGRFLCPFAPLQPFSLSRCHRGTWARKARYTDAVHEMGIALEIYRTCRETIASHGGGRLERVRLAVGELAAVEPELLVYAWEAVVDETPDDDAELEVVWHRANQHCSVCGESKDRSEGSWLRLCPDCGMPLQVDGGDELDILDLSFESDQPDEEIEVGEQETGADRREAP